jgi:hypothetical protein
MIGRGDFVEAKYATNPGCEHNQLEPTSYKTVRILKMSDKDLQSELERLRAENEALKQGRRTGSVALKVSEKGAVSVYGLGRFPVTLYQEQWLKLLAMADEIKQFIEENRGRLKVKE